MNFQLQQKIRNSIRKSSLPPVNTKLFANLEKSYINNINRSSNNGIFINFNKALYRAVNTPAEGAKDYDKFPAVNAHSSPTQAAMKGVGFSPEESFGASFEQVYSPVYIWNQRYADQHKIEWNQGLLVDRSTGNQYNDKGQFNG
jgi:hypothetical protein